MPNKSISDLSFPPGTKKVKICTLSFLYEFAAIPESIRMGYKTKLLKRKNAFSQKNVQLLNLIYEHLEENKISEWDEDSICTKLNISKSMLYCHKSRLLKLLRLIYFGWKEIERNEFNKRSKKSEETNSLKFEKALKMYSIGMQREAKNEFLKLEKIINSKSRKNISDKTILIKIYRQLGTHYYTKKRSVRFNIYYKKFEKLQQRLTKNRKGQNYSKLQIENSLTLNCFKMYKSFFKIKNNTDYTKTIEVYKLINSLTRKSKSKNSYILTILNLGLLHKEMKEYNKAVKHLVKGDELCKKYNLEKESIVFKTTILLTNLLAGKTSFEDTLKEVIKCYERSKELQIKGYLKEKILFQCVSIATLQNNKSLLHNFLYEYNSHCILTNGYQSTHRSLYYMKFDFYFNKIRKFKFKCIGKEKILFVCDTDPLINEKLSTVVKEVSQNFYNMSSIYSKKESLISILMAEFWKGNKLCFEYAQYIIKEIEWLNKSRGKILEFNILLFESLKLCITVIESSKHLNKKELLNKYEQKFLKLSGAVINCTNEDILILYSIFSYTAHITGYLELEDIIANVYMSLKVKYPEVFQPLMAKVKKNVNYDEDTNNKIIEVSIASAA